MRIRRKSFRLNAFRKVNPVEIQTVFIDMDEVLVDFIGGACQAHGFRKSEVHAKWKPGVWSLADQFSILNGQPCTNCDGTGTYKPRLDCPEYDEEETCQDCDGEGAIIEEMTVEQFWEPINQFGELFWLGLDTLPWWQQLISVVQDCTRKEWYVLSAPSHCPTSQTGKIKYLKRMFGDGFDNYLLTRHKHLLAKPGAVLIDDRQENCDNFVAAGGTAILFPSIGNALRDLRDDPLCYVRNQLYALQQR